MNNRDLLKSINKNLISINAKLEMIEMSLNQKELSEREIYNLSYKRKREL